MCILTYSFLEICPFKKSITIIYIIYNIYHLSEWRSCSLICDSKQWFIFTLHWRCEYEKIRSLYYPYPLLQVNATWIDKQKWSYMLNYLSSKEVFGCINFKSWSVIHHPVVAFIYLDSISPKRLEAISCLSALVAKILVVAKNDLTIISLQFHFLKSGVQSVQYDSFGCDFSKCHLSLQRKYHLMLITCILVMYIH